LFSIKYLSNEIGVSRNLEMKADYVVNRTQNSKTALNIGLLQKWNHNYIDNSEIIVQRKQTTTLEVGISQRRYIAKETWDYQLSYHHGIGLLNAQAQENTASEIPTTRYGLWILEIDMKKPVELWQTQARYSLILRGQYTKSTLFSADCFSIGNRYTVRGFDGEQTLLGECGWYWRNELAFPIEKIGAEIYGGLDYGEVSGPATASFSSRKLLGSVLGIRGALWKGNFDIFVSWPLKEPQEMKSQNPTYGFQYTYAI